jgi:hypothetical protein
MKFTNIEIHIVENFLSLRVNLFSWVNAPPCDKCGHETNNAGMGAPLHSEIEYGASRVEIYRYGNK